MAFSEPRQDGEVWQTGRTLLTGLPFSTQPEQRPRGMGAQTITDNHILMHRLLVGQIWAIQTNRVIVKIVASPIMKSTNVGLIGKLNVKIVAGWVIGANYVIFIEKLAKGSGQAWRISPELLHVLIASAKIVNFLKWKSNLSCKCEKSISKIGRNSYCCH